MNWKTINLPAFASALGAAKGAGFDVDEIAIAVTDVFLGRRTLADVPAEIISQIEDVVINFVEDPLATQLSVAGGAILPIATGKGFGFVLKMLGLPKSRKFGKITIKWAL